MSVYPKKLKLGEMVNIHFRIKNINNYHIKGKIIIKIKSKNTETSFSHNILVKKNSIFNYYFRYSPYDVGKHYVIGKFKIKNKEYISKTIKNDYFNVVNANYRYFDLGYFLYSLSPKENFEEIIKDSKKIIKKNKNVMTKIAKKFISKSKNFEYNKLMRINDYKKIIEEK